MESMQCPLCLAQVQTESKPSVGLRRHMCPTCGSFEVEDFDDFDESGALSNLGYPRYLLSHYVRDWNERHGKAYAHADRDNGALPSKLRTLSVTEKLQRTLMWIADKTSTFYDPAKLNRRRDWPVAQARDVAEFDRFIQYWVDEEALKYLSDDDVIVTGKGWRLVDEVRPGGTKGGRQAFVAIPAACAEDYERAIRPAVTNAGWIPYRVENDVVEDKICDQIVAEIRRSDLLIAECTGGRHNVFYEAGFAAGLGIPVIWLAKSNSEEPDLPFDTRQYQHLLWSDHADLRTQLRQHIQARYPDVKE